MNLRLVRGPTLTRAKVLFFSKRTEKKIFFFRIVKEKFPSILVTGWPKNWSQGDQNWSPEIWSPDRPPPKFLDNIFWHIISKPASIWAALIWNRTVPRVTFQISAPKIWSQKSSLYWNQICVEKTGFSDRMRRWNQVYRKLTSFDLIQRFSRRLIALNQPRFLNCSNYRMPIRKILWKDHFLPWKD